MSVMRISAGVSAVLIAYAATMTQHSNASHGVRAPFVRYMLHCMVVCIYVSDAQEWCSLLCARDGRVEVRECGDASSAKAATRCRLCSAKHAPVVYFNI